MRQARAAEFDEFGFRGGGIRFQNHQGFRNFAPLGVGDGNNADFQNGGMRENGFFEFEGGNVFAAADDDVFLAVDDERVAVFVERGHVSRVKPPAAQGFGGSFGLAPVAFHDAVTAHDDFADGLPVVRHVFVVRIYDAQVHAGNCVAGHGLASETLLALPVHSGFHGRNGKRGGFFGQAVARETFAGKFFFDFANERGRRGGATDDNAAQGGELVLLALRAIHQGGGHDGNQAQGLHAFFFNEAENFLGVEALDHDVRAAEHCEEMRDAPTIGVEQRNSVKLDGASFDLQTQADVHSVQVHISVREHYAFGIGAGAAGV